MTENQKDRWNQRLTQRTRTCRTDLVEIGEAEVQTAEEVLRCVKVAAEAAAEAGIGIATAVDANSF